MTSHWQDTCSEMFNNCYNMRNNFPVPASCRDEQLYEFRYEMNYKWSVNNELIQSGKCYDDDDSGLDSWESTLIEQCIYYEDMMNMIDAEIGRRLWLKGKPFPEYVGGGRCSK